MRSHLARVFAIAALPLAALPFAVGCAPADVAGDYTVAVTSGTNECEYDNWTVGDSTTGIELEVTQAEDQVQLDVGGVTGSILDVAVGSSVFSGDVSGNDIDAVLIGTNSGRSGECSFTTTIELEATLDGDAIEGQLRWIPQTNSHPDCGVRENCESLQNFVGVRPPSGD